MRIFRYAEERLPHIKVCGLTFKEVQDRFLNVEEIKYDTDVPDDIEGYYCVVHNDTPLLDYDFLESLAKECEALDTCYTIGDGYITKRGYNGGYKRCENILCYQVKSLADVSFVDGFLREKVKEKLANKNVIIYDYATSFIDFDVDIGDGTVIYPMTSLKGRTKIGKNCIIYSFCDLVDTVVGDNVDIRSTYAYGAKIGDNTTVGPFACLRQGADIGDFCRIGDFVEIKNSLLSDGVKASHLAYVGDSEVGENTNVGCGAVFANYNGVKKQRCVVGSNVFIGANSNLVAPVRVHDGAYIAAGSTVTEDVPAGNLCIARSRQVFKENWTR